MSTCVCGGGPGNDKRCPSCVSQVIGRVPLVDDSRAAWYQPGPASTHFVTDPRSIGTVHASVAATFLPDEATTPALTQLEQAWAEYLRDDESESEICKARGSTEEEMFAAQRRSEASFARAEALGPRPWKPA